MYFSRGSLGWLGIGMLGGQAAHAIKLDLGSADSIKDASKTVAKGMLNYYTGDNPGDIPGNLPDPYYWWEAGAMFGQLIEYWYLTGDDEYNDLVTRGLLHQVGENNDYMPKNQTKTEGNDDQTFWAFAVLSAIEFKFPDPPDPKSPSWLSLAQAVFNLQTIRWDDEHCGGGLRWQVFAWNNGYDYKNSISNGGFFQLAARLALYTGNETYAKWADKSYDWMESSRLMTDDFQIYDGAQIQTNCTKPSPIQWTYNIGTMLMGAANMYNYTDGSQKWRNRLEGMMNATQSFFPKPFGGNILVETACEPQGTCNHDQPSFKAYISRWMAASTQLAPFTTEYVMTKLKASAQGAAGQCSGGPDGSSCGRTWHSTTFDGKLGIGEQMSALSIIQNNLIGKVAGPATAAKGGTSKGDPSAGSQGDNPAGPGAAAPGATSPITIADRAGAGILTALVLGMLVGCTWWICFL